MNGIALHGGTRVYGGTFLVFSDYMRGAVRLAALMQLPVTYVWTHDSIGLGEDGPTHQPVEHLASLRAIPGLNIVRPADANETVIAWKAILENTGKPGRPGPDPPECADLREARRDHRGCRQGRLRPARRRGRRARRDPDGLRLRGAARRRGAAMLAEGIRARVVSMPCREWFDRQERPTATPCCRPSSRRA